MRLVRPHLQFFKLETTLQHQPTLTFKAGLYLLLATTLSACSNLPTEGVPRPATSMVSTDLYGDKSFPVGAKINGPQSLMMGSGENWIGRVVLDTTQNHVEAYNFFAEQYPQQGWALISAVRGKTSLLVFTKADRSATVEIQDGILMNGATAVLTISPKNAPPVPAKAP